LKITHKVADLFIQIEAHNQAQPGTAFKMSQEQWEAYKESEAKQVREIDNSNQLSFYGKALWADGRMFLNASTKFEIEGRPGVFTGSDLNYVRVGMVYKHFGLSEAALARDIIYWNNLQGDHEQIPVAQRLGTEGFNAF